MLEAKNISYKIGEKWLLQQFSYLFQPGKCYMICGPNGAGKSTLLKLLSLELLPATGEVLYNHQPVKYHDKKLYATYRAMLSQNTEIGFPLSVDEIIMMGRYPHFSVHPSKSDHHICQAVVDKLQVAPFLYRNYLTLSGGEKQRVQFARVLSQIWEHPGNGNRILLLDEPISSLDLKYQFDFIHHVKDFIDDKTIVIAILHDLNLALNYADEVLLLNNASLYASGKPAEVLNENNISHVFHLDASIHQCGQVQLLWKKETGNKKGE